MEFLETVTTLKMNCGAEVIAFYSGYCPFTTFHISKFYVDNRQFSNLIQFLAYSAAVLFNDNISRLAIMKNGWKPTEAKKLMKTISNFDETRWELVLESYLLQGLICKFGQNQCLWD